MSANQGIFAADGRTPLIKLSRGPRSTRNVATVRPQRTSRQRRCFSMILIYSTESPRQCARWGTQVTSRRRNWSISL